MKSEGNNVYCNRESVLLHPDYNLLQFSLGTQGLDREGKVCSFSVDSVIM